MITSYFAAFNIVDDDYQPQAIAKTVSDIAVEGKFWNHIPGLFTFRSNLNSKEIASHFQDIGVTAFICAPMISSQVAGMQNAKGWDDWSLEVFKDDLVEIARYHSGMQGQAVAERLLTLPTIKRLSDATDG